MFFKHVFVVQIKIFIFRLVQNFINKTSPTFYFFQFYLFAELFRFLQRFNAWPFFLLSPDTNRSSRTNKLVRKQKKRNLFFSVHESIFRTNHIYIWQWSMCLEAICFRICSRRCFWARAKPDFLPLRSSLFSNSYTSAKSSTGI